MKLLAHITKATGERKEESLKEHSENTAAYAAGSIGDANLYHAAYLAGITHDVGKAKREYETYLEEAFHGRKVVKGAVNHTFAGVIWLFEKYHTDRSTSMERLTCEIIGYAIGSHHGMFDCADLDGKNGFLHRLQKDKKEICYDEAIENYFGQVVKQDEVEKCFQKAVQEVERFMDVAKATYVINGKPNGNKIFFQFSMLVRLILSAVIYGDRKDTSEFMSQKTMIGNSKLKRDWTDWKNYFESKMLEFDSSGKLNQVRNEISRQCLEAAKRKPGIYRLNVPTGGGKTLCALRYALEHAHTFGKKRIVFIIPLLSVLDQNVKVIKDYVPDESEVLEHHSNVIHEIGSGQDGKKWEADKNQEELDEYEFLAESWNYPIVVSTLVQLLNILFAKQTSAIGRMQALCDSVIVIDEVQSLPKKMTTMFNMAMNFLQQYCNATIVLSSATQPCFEELKWGLRLAEKPDLVQLNQEQLQVFKRSEIVNRLKNPGMDYEECAVFLNERMKEHVSLLVVCNTKAEARTLFEKLRLRTEKEGWDIFHLSTAMCKGHRKRVLDALKEKLGKLQHPDRENGNMQKLICISTQMVEAGVDLSFECVARVLAGIDNLAQAAGRCNRSNEYGQTGKVYLINLKSENLSMLQEIQHAQNSTKKVVEYKEAEDSLIGEQATRKFYQYLFQETKKDVDYPICISKNERLYLAELLSNNNVKANTEENKKYVLRQPFKTIGKEFKVFDENTIDVVVPYEYGKTLIKQLYAMQEEWFDLGKFKGIVQQAQAYIVSIFDWQRKKLFEAGLLYRILDGRILILDEKAYNDQFGLTILDEQPVENYIF